MISLFHSPFRHVASGRLHHHLSTVTAAPLSQPHKLHVVMSTNRATIKVVHQSYLIGKLLYSKSQFFYSFRPSLAHVEILPASYACVTQSTTMAPKKDIDGATFILLASLPKEFHGLWHAPDALAKHLQGGGARGAGKEAAAGAPRSGDAAFDHRSSARHSHSTV